MHGQSVTDDVYFCYDTKRLTYIEQIQIFVKIYHQLLQIQTKNLIKDVADKIFDAKSEIYVPITHTKTQVFMISQQLNDIIKLREIHNHRIRASHSNHRKVLISEAG